MVAGPVGARSAVKVGIEVLNREPILDRGMARMLHFERASAGPDPAVIRVSLVPFRGDIGQAREEREGTGRADRLTGKRLADPDRLGRSALSVPLLRGARIQAHRRVERGGRCNRYGVVRCGDHRDSEEKDQEEAAEERAVSSLHGITGPGTAHAPGTLDPVVRSWWMPSDIF